MMVVVDQDVGGANLFNNAHHAPGSQLRINPLGPPSLKYERLEMETGSNGLRTISFNSAKDVLF